jgi:colicin import membrane protein
VLAQEDSRREAERSGKLAQYIDVIRQKVERNWAPPAGATSGLSCDVQVTQIPGGEVVNVRIGTCNGDAAVMRSIEAAVYKASPLPPPPDPSLFERELLFKFEPE